MSAPPPIDWSDPAAPRSAAFGDVYYSLDDGLAESRAVFLQGCGLPDAWAGRERFTVAELGFGTGLNIVALLDLWARNRPPGGRLHTFTLEAFPLAREDAARALSAWPEVSGAADLLLRRWPAPARGWHRIDIPEVGATIDLAVGDALDALTRWSGRADAWFLDGFSPALNPDMWSEPVLDAIAARSAPGARVATFTVAGAVRRGLAARGFAVDKRPGHGRKRERLEARLEGTPAPGTLPRVAIVGAGVAGAAVARALTAQGHSPLVLEADNPGSGASGFASALVTPRLDAGDEALAALFAQALHRAADLYRATPGAVLAEGVIRLEHAARDAARFDRIAAQDLWPEGSAERLSSEDVSNTIGEPAPGAIGFANALAIAPAAVLAHWLQGIEVRPARIARLERRGDLWALLDAEGAVIAEAEAVVLAGGWAGSALAPGGLSPVRGQATAARTGQPGATALTWGGYVAPLADGMLFGATHDRGRDDTAPDPADDQRNLDSLARALPALAARLEDVPLEGRAAIRAVTADKLPVCGALGDGLHILSGLGSRGWTTAPLLGEHIAATLTGALSPLPADFALRLAPLRPGGLAQPERGADS